ncbi:MAG TPA: (d)CMP kinase [Thiomicrospira sp.]|jgi:cytidylate kinase|nr:(d)CMP kinase [Thiomicrospira sp.]
MIPIITVDGPSGVGKGTLTQWLCDKTGFQLLDSGAIYRALAYGSVIENIKTDDISALVSLAKELPVSFESGSIFYKGKDVTANIRNEQTAAVASVVAAIPEVRAALLQRQKDFAQLPGLIADGRDMGTIVFPNAVVKLFLTASAEIRAKRRVEQLKKQGVNANISQITRDIEERDLRDRTRSASPLVPAKDAVTIDTTFLSIEEVCKQAENILFKQGVGV